VKKLALVIQPFYIGDIDNSKKNSTVKIQTNIWRPYSPFCDNDVNMTALVVTRTCYDSKTAGCTLYRQSYCEKDVHYFYSPSNFVTVLAKNFCDTSTRDGSCGLLWNPSGLGRNCFMGK